MGILPSDVHDGVHARGGDPRQWNGRECRSSVVAACWAGRGWCRRVANMRWVQADFMVWSLRNCSTSG
jgi:hypothetical protein